MTFPIDSVRYRIVHISEFLQFYMHLLLCCCYWCYCCCCQCFFLFCFSFGSLSVRFIVFWFFMSICLVWLVNTVGVRWSPVVPFDCDCLNGALPFVKNIQNVNQIYLLQSDFYWYDNIYDVVINLWLFIYKNNYFFLC